jgi:hypothetical protein
MRHRPVSDTCEGLAAVLSRCRATMRSYGDVTVNRSGHSYALFPGVLPVGS